MRQIVVQRFVGLTSLLALLAPVLAQAEPQATGTAGRKPGVDVSALPLGNGQYSSEPRKSYIYACRPDIFYHIAQTGAHGPGPWVHGSSWDLTQKPVIQGAVRWPIARMNVSVEGDRRSIAGDGLPLAAPTGIFPVLESDPAYAWDRNPNPIGPQHISLSLPRDPQPAAHPNCVELPVGIGLDGVVFFSALDSHGRDEPAYEMQDRCGGMSAPNNMYHRYMPSDCIPHIRERSALVGYGLDGFGIYSPYDENGKELSTKDLDECHGRTSPVMWDGELKVMYHYVLTYDFPYSISCFRGVPTQIPLPPPPPPFGFLPKLFGGRGGPPIDEIAPQK